MNIKIKMNFITSLFDFFYNLFTLKQKEREQYQQTISDLNSEIERLKEENESYLNNINENKEKINNLQEQIDLLNRKLKELTTTPLENELNSKYPKKKVLYYRIETDGTYSVDVRTFINKYDDLIPTVKGKDDDEIALNALKWVMKNIKYISDKTQYNYSEYWAYPYQTLKRKKGDCEDGAILLANIMLKSGIPYYKIRLCCGDTPLGGHAYVVYYYEKGRRWVSLDWCYFANSKKIKDRSDYKNELLYGDVWFSWNQKYAFAKGTKTGINEIKIK